MTEYRIHPMDRSRATDGEPMGEKVPEGVAARIRKGIELYAEREREISRVEGSCAIYRVPSRSKPGLKRFVYLMPEAERCSCPDFSKNKLGCCAHTVAALIADSKRLDYVVEERHDSRFGTEFAVAEYRGGRHVRDRGFRLSYDDAVLDCEELSGGVWTGRAA